MFAMLNKEIDGILNNVIDLVYFMRGAVSYEEMMNRSLAERERMGDFIAKRLDSQKKTMNPVY